MELDIKGLKIARAYRSACAVDVDFDNPEVGFKFEDKYTVTRSGQTFQMFAEVDDEDRVRECFESIIGVSVDSAIARESGELWVRFVDGSLLEAGPGDKYEPWAYYGPRGARVWSLPGGRITASPPSCGE